MADANLQRQIQDSQPAERTAASLEGLATFAFNYGFQESYIRGLRSTFLTSNDYKQLQAVETIDDFRTVCYLFTIYFDIGDESSWLIII